MPVSLTGKVAIVTGAARGIGRGVALEFARCGADVAVLDSAQDDSTGRVAEEIRAMGRKSLAVCADVADERCVQAMMAEVVSTLGRIDILVNNAAFSVRKPFLETLLEESRRTMQVSQWGTYVCSYVALQQMVKQGSGGSVVMISSVHGERPYPNAAAYNMSKAGTNHLAASLALEFASEGIRVNTVEPGWIDTPGERIHHTDREIAERGKTLPMQRLGTAGEVAKAVAFLCSEDASYISGATLRVDGGFALKF